MNQPSETTISIKISASADMAERVLDTQEINEHGYSAYLALTKIRERLKVDLEGLLGNIVSGGLELNFDKNKNDLVARKLVEMGLNLNDIDAVLISTEHINPEKIEEANLKNQERVEFVNYFRFLIEAFSENLDQNQQKKNLQIQ